MMQESQHSFPIVIITSAQCR